MYENDQTLSRVYELNIEQVLISINVQARIIKSPTVEQPFRVKASGFNFEFDYNPLHAFFEESLNEPVDCLLVDLAHYFFVVSAQSTREWPVSKILRMLREKYFPDTLTNVSPRGRDGFSNAQ